MSQKTLESPSEEEIENAWLLRRTKEMLRDFLVDVVNETDFTKDTTLDRVDAFIDKWVKYHFQC